jgi:hypothetical protein
VGATPQPHALHRRRAATSDWIDVIELEKLARTASAPVVAGERALAPIPLPDRPPDGRGNVALPGALALLRARLGGGGELLLLELPDQSVERAIQHLGEISRGNAV